MTARSKLAVGYCRISKHDNETDVSIEVQGAAVRQWCDDEGLHFVGMFKDEGKSGGKTSNRPGYQAALEAVVENGAVLVIYDWSRLSRDAETRLHLRNTLPVVSVSEQNDDTDEGKLMFTFKSGFDEYFRARVSTTTKAALRKLRANGKRYSRIIPFGLAVNGDGKTLVKHHAEQLALRYLKRIAGAPRYTKTGRTVYKLALRDLAARMDERGVPPRGGGKWNGPTISNILKRERR